MPKIKLEAEESKKHCFRINIVSSEDSNSLLELLISPAAQAMQVKQQMGFPLITACRNPGIQLWLHTDSGLYFKTSKYKIHS